MSMIERTLNERLPQPHQEVTGNGRQYMLTGTSLIWLPDEQDPTGIIVLLSDVTTLQQLQWCLIQEEHHR